MSRSAAWSPEVTKEVRALLPFWAAAASTLAAAFALRQIPSGIALMAYIAGTIGLGAQSIGQEYSHRTLPMLLAQPVDRRRVYAIKALVAAVLLVALAALARALFGSAWSPESAEWMAVVLPALGGLFLAPLLTMISRSTLAGMVLSVSAPAAIWIVALVVGWFGFAVDAETMSRALFDRWPLATLACAPLGLLTWRQFMRLETTTTAGPSLSLPRWLSGAGGGRRHSPWRALAVKELHLHQLTLAIAALYNVGWVIAVLLQRYVPSIETAPLESVLLLYCLGLAIVTGSFASAEERHHHTLDWQLLQPVPAWQQWTVKAGVAVGLSLVFAIAMPALLVSIAPRHDIAFVRPDALAFLAAAVLLLTTGSLYLSSLSTSGVRAMTWSLPAGVGVALFIQIVSNLALGGVGALMIVGRARFTLVLVPLLLWFGFLNHTTPERTLRRVLAQAGAIALVIAAGLVLIGASPGF